LISSTMAFLIRVLWSISGFAFCGISDFAEAVVGLRSVSSDLAIGNFA